MRKNVAERGRPQTKIRLLGLLEFMERRKVFGFPGCYAAWIEMLNNMSVSAWCCIRYFWTCCQIKLLSAELQRKCQCFDSQHLCTIQYNFKCTLSTKTKPSILFFKIHSSLTTSKKWPLSCSYSYYNDVWISLLSNLWCVLNSGLNMIWDHYSPYRSKDSAT